MAAQTARAKKRTPRLERVESLLNSYVVEDEDIEMASPEEHIDVFMKDADSLPGKKEEDDENRLYCRYCNNTAGNIKDPVVNLAEVRIYCKPCLRYCNRGRPTPRHIRVYASSELGECGICMEVPCENPTVTVCGHFFCGACLAKWARMSRVRTYACPICKIPLESLLVFPLVTQP